MIELVVRIYDAEDMAMGAQLAADIERALDTQRERWRAQGKHGAIEFEIMPPARKPDRRRRGSPAEALLEEAFAEDRAPLARDDLLQLAAERDISKAQMDRAKAKLRIAHIEARDGRPHLWGPPGSADDPHFLIDYG
jgi:hypothetical protein